MHCVNACLEPFMQECDLPSIPFHLFTLDASTSANHHPSLLHLVS